MNLQLAKERAMRFSNWKKRGDLCKGCSKPLTGRTHGSQLYCSDACEKVYLAWKRTRDKHKGRMKRMREEG